MKRVNIPIPESLKPKIKKIAKANKRSAQAQMAAWIEEGVAREIASVK